MEKLKIGTMLVDGKIVDLDNEDVEKLSDVEKELKKKENDIKSKIKKIIH